MNAPTVVSDWNRPRIINEAISDLMEEFDVGLNHVGPGSIPTGIVDLDKSSSVLRPGSLVVIAGRPALGKTSFALNVASHVALEQKLPTLVFSMDLSSVRVAARLVCQTGRIDLYDFRIGKLGVDDKERAIAAMDNLKRAELYIDETPALRPNEICSRTQEIRDKHGRIGLVVIDYLQAIAPTRAGDHPVEDYRELMLALRRLAKDINAPVVVLSQLNRKLEKRKDKRPRLSDLPGESIFRHADVVLFLYRDELYDPDSLDKGITEIIVGRNRHGPTGTIQARFLGEFGCFDNLPGRHQ